MFRLNSDEIQELITIINNEKLVRSQVPDSRCSNCSTNCQGTCEFSIRG